MLGATTATNTTASTNSMLGATTAPTHSNTTMLRTTVVPNTTTSATNMDSNAFELTCMTCLAEFERKEMKRAHMRDEWHVYNLKRRIANLNPISHTIFRTQICPSPSVPSKEEEEEEEEEEGQEASDTNSEFRTPFLESSSEDEERSESSDEDEEQEVDEADERHNAVRIGDDLCLKSGKILSHRSRARQSQRRHYRQRPHLQPPLCPSPSSSTSSHLSTETINLILSHRPSHPSSQQNRMESLPHGLVIRKGTETSLLGIPEKQQRALLSVAKKMEASGGRTVNEFRAGLERKGNCQKTFRVKSIGKKAGGLEKRLG